MAQKSNPVRCGIAKPSVQLPTIKAEQIRVKESPYYSDKGITTFLGWSSKG